MKRRTALFPVRVEMAGGLGIVVTRGLGPEATRGRQPTPDLEQARRDRRCRQARTLGAPRQTLHRRVFQELKVAVTGLDLFLEDRPHDEL